MSLRPDPSSQSKATKRGWVEGIFKITFLGIRRQKWHRKQTFFAGAGRIVGGVKTDLNLASQDPVVPLSPFPRVGEIKAEGKKRNCNRSREVRRERTGAFTT